MITTTSLTLTGALAGIIYPCMRRSLIIGLPRANFRVMNRHLRGKLDPPGRHFRNTWLRTRSSDSPADLTNPLNILVRKVSAPIPHHDEEFTSRDFPGHFPSYYTKNGTCLTVCPIFVFLVCPFASRVLDIQLCKNLLLA